MTFWKSVISYWCHEDNDGTITLQRLKISGPVTQNNIYVAKIDKLVKQIVNFLYLSMEGIF